MNSRIRQMSVLFAYHIVLHVHGRRKLFKEDEDYEYFLYCLQRASQKYNVQIVAHALMGNHVHLIAQGALLQIPLVFQSMGGSFAKWHNQKYGMRGALYDRRYWSKPIQNRKQYISALAYVFNNPVEAKLVSDPADYEWSSFGDLTCQKSELIDYSVLEMICDVELLAKITRSRYAKEPDPEITFFERPQFTDDEVKAIIRGEIGKFDKRFISSHGDKCLQRILEKLLEHGISLAQMSRNTGLSTYKIKKLLI